MFSLKNHPFAVETFFESSVVLTFAIPKETLQPLIPPCLELDTLHNKWAFVAAALVTTKKLRPKGFPEFMGYDFILIGFRIFVKYKNAQGKRLRGLYIIKSETNKARMSFFGNLFTHYNYTTTDVASIRTSDLVSFTSAQSRLEIEGQLSTAEIKLPPDSPFSDWKEARRYAGPLPFTFTYNATSKEVLIIEGVRQHWEPRPIVITHYKISFIERKFPGAILANAFIVENIPYHWKKGKIEVWNG